MRLRQGDNDRDDAYHFSFRYSSVTSLAPFNFDKASKPILIDQGTVGGVPKFSEHNYRWCRSIPATESFGPQMDP